MFRRNRAQGRSWKLFLVSHTHWDREWYLPFQQFRASLVDAVDSLLELMAGDPDYRYFTLDGQTIVLEDYLEVRPERERELRDLISAGRLLIGPWYVMPDEFLVSGESLVRNLLEGRRTAARFGPLMKVGYIPDPFGHVSQLPQILRGFDIDAAVLWRGVGSELRHNEALWAAPDGSEVLLEHLPSGYDNGALLPVAPEALAERLSQIRSELEPGATTGCLLLMNGDDHMFPQAEVPAVVREANRLLRDGEMIDGTLPMLIQHIREEAAAAGVEWERIEGELRSSERAHLLAGVLSSRMGLKQRNFQCQTLLERWAEPFSGLAGLVPAERAGDAGRTLTRVARDAPALLRLAWRYLLTNHPHDSICGCSIDQVHQEMGTRFDWCEQLAGLVADRALDALAGAANTEGLKQGNEGAGAIAVFNSESGPRTDYVTALVQPPRERGEASLLTPEGDPVRYQLLRELHTELASLTLSRTELQGYLRLSGPGKDWPPWKLRILEKILRAALRGRLPDLAVIAMDVVPGTDPSTVEVAVEAAAGRSHDLDALSAGLRQLSNLVERGDAQHFRVRVRRRDQVEVGFVAPEVPAHGLKLFHFGPPSPSRAPALLHREEPTLENEYISLQISPEDGTARLIDRETGNIYWGVNSFADGGDAGDEYTYSPPGDDLVVRGPEDRPTVTLEERGPTRQVVRVEFKMSLPATLSSDRRTRSGERVACPLATWLTLYPGVPRVDIRTVFTNLACDHRLRVHFPTHLDATTTAADGHFAVVERPIQGPEGASGWMEHPVTSSPQLAFVDVSGGESGLMIANRGLPEFDVAKEERGPCIALTLLRCVGWLSRDDLATRQGAAGPILPTPGAQMPGTHAFEYSVIPHAGGWEAALRQAYWFARPLRAVWTGRHPGPMPPEASLLSVTPSALALSAVKPAAGERGGLIVRLYNLTGAPADAVLRTLFPLESAELTNLAEDPGEELPLEEPHTLRFPVGGHQIVTLRLTAPILR